MKAKAGILAASAGAAAAAFTPHYADFDGTTDYAIRGAGLTGAVDGKQGILSSWVIFDSLATANKNIFTSVTANRFIFNYLLSSNVLRVRGDTAAGVETLQLRVNSALTTGVAYHILMSWDLASAGSGRVYLDDVSAKTETTYNNNNIDYTDTDHSFAAQGAGSNKFDGKIGEFYVHLGAYLDFDVTANRRLFRTAGGAPVDLGSSGATPTGSQPAVYFSLRAGDAANDFINNRGGGGAFTLAGALADGGAI